jgi:hypothetical protein
MNKNVVISVAAVIVIFFAIADCGRNNDHVYRIITNTPTQTCTITQTPTITMTPAIFVYYSGGGMVEAEYPVTLIWTPINATGFGIALRYNDSNGRPLSGASVDVNGNTLTEDGNTGNYLYYDLNRNYSPGDTVQLNIVTGIGSASASAVIPQRAAFTWPDSGDTLDPGIDNTIHWYYTGAQPDEVSISAARAVINPPQIFLDVVLPGSVTQYTIPAGTLPAGQDEIFLLISGVENASCSGVEPWSNSFTVRNGKARIIKTQ